MSIQQTTFLFTVLLLSFLLISCQKIPAQQTNYYDNAEPFPVGKALVNLNVIESFNNEPSKGTSITAEVVSVEGYGSGFGNPLATGQIIKVNLPIADNVDDFRKDVLLSGYLIPIVKGESQDQNENDYEMYDFTLKP